MLPPIFAGMPGQPSLGLNWTEILLVVAGLVFVVGLFFAAVTAWIIILVNPKLYGPARELPHQPPRPPRR